MKFRRPDGTTASAKWLVACHEHAARYNFDPSRMKVMNDATYTGDN